jgi:lipopolysaccharide export system protein LptA
LVFGSVLFAQDAQQSTAAKGNQETTLTGCLNKGAGPSQYVLTDQSTGNKTPVTGTSDLEQHAMNHTVKLTGNTTTENGRAVFTATKVEHLSATCASPSEKK